MSNLIHWLASAVQMGLYGKDSNRVIIIVLSHAGIDISVDLLKVLCSECKQDTISNPCLSLFLSMVFRSLLHAVLPCFFTKEKLQ